MTGARLLVVQGVDQGRRFEVAQSTVRIGRGVQNDIRVLDTEVSRRHAVLSQANGEWRVADAGSSNGTFLNGRAVTSEVLKPGDQIQVGRTVLLFAEVQEFDSTVAFGRVDLTIDPEDASQIVGSIPYEAAQSLGRRATPGVREWSPSEANLEVLYRISEEAVRPAVSLDQLLKRILDLTLAAVDADRGVVFVADSKTDQIEPRVVSLRDGMSVDEKFPVSRTIVEYVIQQGEGIHTSDAGHDVRFEEGQSILKAGIREAMCVPVRGRYELLGVLYVDTTTSQLEAAARKSRSRFSRELLTLLAAIGRQSALAVENNRFQEALVAAERLAAVGQTTAILGHDIKNILQAMKGGSYLIDQGLRRGDTGAARKGWETVERNQDRILGLVTDMLSFSKERPPRMQLADINATVREVCDLVAPGAEERGVDLVFLPAAELGRALFDADAMHRAVLNIVTNALEAVNGTEAASVMVTTSFNLEEHLLTVTVTDNGPGIPSEELPHLFNLFHSEKGSRGTGLGLAVSQKILQEHGGKIWVESQPGEGAAFHLRWPAHDEEGEGSSVNRVPAG